ncbi:tyrosine recombinase XerD [Spirochaetia bacterium]|nr:tyrosine recombinase XerD [Spirochaetia bacterium]
MSMEQLTTLSKNFGLSAISNVNDIESKLNQYFQGYSTKTILAYQLDLKKWVSFTHKTLQESSESDIMGYIKMLESKGYKNSTINRSLSSLAKLYSTYMVLGIIDYNPIRRLSESTRIYKSIDPQAKFLITKMDIEMVIQKSTPRISAIIKFLANTGLRISEMVNIRYGDIEPFDNEYMRIKINGKGNKLRFVYIPLSLYLEIKNRFVAKSDYLFHAGNGKQLSRINLYKRIRNVFERYANRKNVRCHDLRHFFATEKIVNEKKDYKAVSKYLGHSSVSTTLSIYCHSELKPEESQIL